tara:strand:+ start:935 stop:1171 length:237 start_codon:yes stop_codon:yes gene_type:complete
MTYNGWRNRETWLVNLWFNPVTKSDIDYLEEWLPQEFDTMVKSHYGDGHGASTIFHDMIDFHIIDWDELREAMEDEKE